MLRTFHGAPHAPEARQLTIEEMGYNPDNYWLLFVYLHPQIGVDKVWVEALGPFGKTERSWFDNGVGAYARLDLAKNDFPAGYQYKIGIGAGSPDGSLPSQLTWFIETSTGGWQKYSYVYNNDNGTELLYTDLCHQNITRCMVGAG